jgi:hypothetical protein
LPALVVGDVAGVEVVGLGETLPELPEPVPEGSVLFEVLELEAVSPSLGLGC